LVKRGTKINQKVIKPDESVVYEKHNANKFNKVKILKESNEKQKPAKAGLKNYL